MRFSLLLDNSVEIYGFYSHMDKSDCRVAFAYTVLTFLFERKQNARSLSLKFVRSVSGQAASSVQKPL